MCQSKPILTRKNARGRGSSYVTGVIDVEALRDHRARAKWDNWMKEQPL